MVGDGIIKQVTAISMTSSLLHIITLKTISPKDSLLHPMEHVTEVCCYTGPVLSLVIAWRLANMDSRSWIHNMLLLYFSLDAVCGTAATALIFRLYGGR